MKLVVLLALLGCIAAAPANQEAVIRTDLHGSELRDFINSVQSNWVAGDADTSRHHTLMDVMFLSHPEGTVYKEDSPSTRAIPASFDARTKWPHCKTIKQIRDQSQCGACWAFAAAEALSDRICIGSDGKHDYDLSAEDALSCCGSFCGNGCKGGYPIRAWSWAMQKGLCTGGGFYENDGCKPYTIEPCGTHTVNGVTHHHDCPAKEPDTPSCHSACTNKNYHTAYASDKHHASSAYAVKESVAAIQEEIMDHGPVEASFTVYEDFDHYKSGVYHHVSGNTRGGHAVKILGWGEESGTHYWLVANSWNTNWGESGFFKIRRGNNECGIEAGIVAGHPKV